MKEAFVAYFKSHNENRRQDFDGAGFVRQSRLIDFTEEVLVDLLSKAKNNTSEAFKIINHLAYLSISFFGDIKSEWDIRVKTKFLN